MCGIAGFNFKDEALIKTMSGAISHRGPDGEGFYVDNNVSLGHKRLSIIDLSDAGRQPMSDADGRYWIIFNGEIYNFKEIRRELEEKYHFRSQTDTEVIIYAYKEWGEECLKKFNGIFAFAIYDKDKNKIFLARDRFGVKPLYYYYNNSRFVFSSEAKAILEHDFVKREINFRALNNYLRFLYVLGPETMWQDIKKMPPGHSAIFENNILKIKKYYELNINENINNEERAAVLVKDGVFAAVRRQLVSDRPVGLFLSGGLDSSIICAAMSKESSGPVKTFSVGFDIDVEREKFNADFSIAKKTAGFFDTDHHEITVSVRDISDNFEKCVIAMDEPVSNHIQVPTYMLAREAKKEVAVVLGGDGGDETFGGYDRYYYAGLIEKIWRFAPFFKGLRSLIKLGTLLGKENAFVKLAAADDFHLYLSFMAQKEEKIAAFLRPEYNSPESIFIYQPHFNRPDGDIANKMMAADIATWLPDESLVRSDKLTMAHGLEERVPFLDNDLARLAFSIPSKLKLINKFYGKRILRNAFRGIVPDFVLMESKRGFFSPAAKWLRTGLKGLAYEILSPGYTDKTAGLFNWENVRKILDEHIEHKNYSLNTVWSLMTFQVWARNYL